MPPLIKSTKSAKSTKSGRPAKPAKPDIIDAGESSEVDYTPEELESIEQFTRFFDRAPGQVNTSLLSKLNRQDDFAETPGRAADGGRSEEDASPVSADEPSDLGDIPDLGDTSPASADEPSDLGDIPDLGDAFPASVDEPGDLGDIPDLGDTSPASVDEPGDLGDIPDLGDASPASVDEPGDLGDIPDLGDASPASADEPGDLGDIPDLGDTSPASVDEPDDLGDIPDLGDAFPASVDEPGDLGDIPELGDAFPASVDEPGDLGDIPELGDAFPASVEEPGDLGDIPELGDAFPASVEEPGDLGDIPELGDAFPASVEEPGDLGDIPELGDAFPASVEEPGDLGDIPELGDAFPASVEEPGDLGDIPELGDTSPASADGSSTEVGEGLSPPSLEDLSLSGVTFSKDSPDSPAPPRPTDPTPKDEAYFSDGEIKDIRKKLKAYPLQIRRLSINTIVEDKLSADDIRSLVDMLLKGSPVKQVQKFLEEKLHVDLGDIAKTETSQARVVVSKAHYSVERLEKTARNIKRLKYVSLIGSLLILAGFTLYQTVIKPWLYRRLIKNAQVLILSEKPKVPSPASIDQAEKLFSEAENIYPQDAYGYLQLANAYQQIGLYQNAFEKLFGKVSLSQTTRLYGENIDSSKKYWKKTRSVPTIRYSNGDFGQLKIDRSLWNLEKKGAYLISYLDKKENDAKVLMALGRFHSNPVKRFKDSPYRNNLLGIDYFKRILTFEVKTPFFRKDETMAMALGGIGDVYYQQKDHYISNEYFAKIIANQPGSVIGHAGIIKNLLKLYSKQKDPRLVIDYHNKIKYGAQVEDKLPLHTLSALAAFYIDLPKEGELRVSYNISPNESANKQALKNRSIDLLNILYRSERKDEYGNINEGRYFAEGYYQRGRYFRNILNQPRVAMEQFEYAYQYNPGHFLSLNERAEILIDLSDYNGAMKHLQIAVEQLTPEKLQLLGDSPEDETLMDADIAKIYFNYGKSIYLSIIQDLGDTNSWQRIQETEKYNIGLEFGTQALVRELDKAEVYFKQADQIGVFSEKTRTELNYFQGWSAYAKGNPQKALFHWNSIASERELRYRNLELAKSHALYKLGVRQKLKKSKSLQAALGYLLFLQEHYEKRAGDILKPSGSNKAHIRLFTRLAIIENNLGAIYELLEDEARATEHYWKSVDYSQRVSRENEIARYNLKLSFKRAGLADKESIPVIMDYIPPRLYEVLKN